MHFHSALHAGRVILLAALLIAGPLHAASPDWASLNGQVMRLYQERKYEDGLKLAIQALALAQKTYGPDHRSTGSALNNLAMLHEALDQYDKALPLYRRALAISEKLNGPDHADTASRLDSLAGLLDTLGEYDQALPLYRRVLRIHETVYGPNHSETAMALNSLGLLLRTMSRYDEALPLLLRAHAISEKENGPAAASTLSGLSNLAALYKSMGRYDEALPLARRALDHSEKINGPEHARTGLRLHNLASIHEAMGQYEIAAPMYQRALSIAERTDGVDHPNTGNTLNNLAGTWLAMGQPEKALPLFQRALAISERVRGPEHPEVATGLNNLGLLYESMGEYDKALPLFQRSIAISEKRQGKDHPETASSLANLAGLYESMGQPEKALPLYLRTLAIREKVHGKGHALTGADLNNLAVTYRALERHQEALEHAARAAALIEKAHGPQHPSTATALDNLAVFHSKLNQHQEALALTLRSLAIVERSLGAMHPSTASTLSNLAGIYRDLNQYDKALPLYLRAYAIAQAARRPVMLQTIQGNLAQFYQDQHKPDLAIFFGKHAVNTAQSIRGHAKGLDQDLQKSLLNQNKHIYERLAQWLIEAGRLPEAQQVLAMLKEDELQGYSLRSGQEDARQSTVSLSGPEADWARRSAASSGELGSLAARIDVLQKIAPASLSADQKKELDQALDRISQVQQAFEQSLLAIQADAEAGSAKASRDVRSAADRAANNLRELLDKLAEDSGTKPAALQYLVTDKKLFILASLPNLQFSREVAIDAKTLRRQIEQFRQVLRSPQFDPRPQAQALHKLLIDPVRKDLQAAKIDHLMISLTDALRYIPFSALHDGEHYLMQDFQLSVMTEASLGARMDRPKAQWTVSALGVSDKVSDAFDALPAVPRELGAIVRSSTSPDGAMPGQIHLNAAFTADQYRDTIALRPSVIHIATHFKFAAGTESQSYLLLGDGKPLSLSDMMSERYRFRGLDLLTLSACETAVGGGLNQNGREVEGLGAQAQRFGAPAVIATLWQVADDSTGQLMKRFYALRAQSPALNKSEALRRAQIELLEGRALPPATEANAVRSARAQVANGTAPAAPPYPYSSRQPYAHPFFWAPFVLMGNWL